MIANYNSDSNNAPPAVASSDDELRILILAPTGIDAHFTADFLTKAEFSPRICDDVLDLCYEIGFGCGAIVLAEETLADISIRNLLSCLSAQPSWSDIPIILVTKGGEASSAQLRRLGTFGPRGNVTLLERPFRPGTLVSTLETALRSRRRQYEARDFMETVKQARDEAEMASRAKDAFLAALSHELRTPLSPALLIASEYAFDNQLPEDARQNFDIIRKNIELEARLIDDLLDLTRVTAGKLVLEREDVDVHQVLLDAVETVRGEIEKKDIQLDLHLSAEHSTINGDAVRLEQIFWNVLTNAVKFTPKNGTITVESFNVRRQNQNMELLIRVTDTGIGMTPEESARVFNAFVQGDHANSNSNGYGNNRHRFGGLGLGLAISKNLVHLHSGTITAESAGRNQGATFSITLPLVGMSEPRP